MVVPGGRGDCWPVAEQFHWEPFHVSVMSVEFMWGDSGLENVGAVPGEVGQVRRADPTQAQRRIVGEAEQQTMDGGELGGGEQQTLIVERDQAGVEEGIELCGE